jgi:isopentenyl-diphosphate delta-isomerase
MEVRRVGDLHRIVSSEGEELILVDVADNVVGYGSKADCHDGSGVMHRAFSLFLFNDDGELLLQQRGKDKRLWPGFWSNSCCSHPRRGETLPVATMRRLSDELNISAELEYVYQFCYEATFGPAGSENELCHVFLGRVEGQIRPNDSEIESVRFISATELDSELAENPERFTPWLKKEWQSLRGEYAAQLGRYAI